MPAGLLSSPGEKVVAGPSAGARRRGPSELEATITERVLAAVAQRVSRLFCTRPGLDEQLASDIRNHEPAEASGGAINRAMLPLSAEIGPPSACSHAGPPLSSEIFSGCSPATTWRPW